MLLVLMWFIYCFIWSIDGMISSLNSNNSSTHVNAIRIRCSQLLNLISIIIFLRRISVGYNWNKILKKEWYQEIEKQLIEPLYEDNQEQKRVLGLLNKNDLIFPIPKMQIVYWDVCIESKPIYTEGEMKQSTKLASDKWYAKCVMTVQLEKAFHMQARARQEFCIFISACVIMTLASLVSFLIFLVIISLACFKFRTHSRKS